MPDGNGDSAPVAPADGVHAQFAHTNSDVRNGTRDRVSVEQTGTRNPEWNQARWAAVPSSCQRRTPRARPLMCISSGTTCAPESPSRRPPAASQVLHSRHTLPRSSAGMSAKIRPRRRPKSVQRGDRLRKYANSRAEGGRFELPGHPTTGSPTRARKCWRHKGFRYVFEGCIAGPKEPERARENPA
jgi:hypothetical protein